MLPIGDALGLGERAADMLGHGLRGVVDIRLRRQRPVVHDVLRGPEVLGETGRIIGEVGVRRDRVGGSDQHGLAVGIPGANADLGHLSR